VRGVYDTALIPDTTDQHGAADANDAAVLQLPTEWHDVDAL
jgi:hypothetical protein